MPLLTDNSEKVEVPLHLLHLPDHIHGRFVGGIVAILLSSNSPDRRFGDFVLHDLAQQKRLSRVARKVWKKSREER